MSTTELRTAQTALPAAGDNCYILPRLLVAAYVEDATRGQVVEVEGDKYLVRTVDGGEVVCLRSDLVVR